jgi:hypothetical protein
MNLKLALIGAACLGLMAPASYSQTKWPDDGGVSDFYAWSPALPKQPGRMLRTEPMTDKAPLANAAQSIRILHTSTDGLDGKTRNYVSGELYIPKGQAPKGGWPLMAWAHGNGGDRRQVCAVVEWPRPA